MLSLIVALALTAPTYYGTLPRGTPQPTPAMGARQAEAPPAEPGLCPAAQYQDLIGQPATAAEAIPQPKRVLHPDDMATMDHRPDRTNVHLDDEGVIQSLRCG
ncbi:I78 family peptidase inhibitor [Sagittula salina]|uniref:Peptidase inhibitor I78 family protein n=1 Tax=Sagittula salina TaxID=2820268 RepID=A0A940MKG7_9RHOB|nr:I78 family peptidase inhibitor [Sagittula salina]MBP0483161.1 hypothetical protein [Sagittula salina]